MHAYERSEYQIFYFPNKNWFICETIMLSKFVHFYHILCMILAVLYIAYFVYM